MKIQFKDSNDAAGVHSNGGTPTYYVVVDGERVGVVRKRSEWYGNLGHRGVRYHYFDFFRIDADGRAIHEEDVTVMRDGTERTNRRPLVTGSTRRDVVAEALTKLEIA